MNRPYAQTAQLPRPPRRDRWLPLFQDGEHVEKSTLPSRRPSGASRTSSTKFDDAAERRADDDADAAFTTLLRARIAETFAPASSQRSAAEASAFRSQRRPPPAARSLRSVRPRDHRRACRSTPRSAETPGPAMLAARPLARSRLFVYPAGDPDASPPRAPRRRTKPVDEHRHHDALKAGAQVGDLCSTRDRRARTSRGPPFSARQPAEIPFSRAHSDRRVKRTCRANARRPSRASRSITTTRQPK